MAHCWNKIDIAINFCIRKKMIWALMFIISNHYGIKCLSNLLQLEPCNDMFKVISDIIPHWNNLWNTIVIDINFWNAKKMICALIFIKSYHEGIKCLNNPLQLVQYNIMINIYAQMIIFPF